LGIPGGVVEIDQVMGGEGRCRLESLHHTLGHAVAVGVVEGVDGAACGFDAADEFVLKIVDVG
jgi:hypothetical protein